MTKDIQDYIFKHGKRYEPANFPPDLEKGEVGDCYDTCILNVVKNPKYRYVEGIAAHPFKENVWIMHAWLTDGVHAYDPTWRIEYKQDDLPVLTLYYGIEMDTAKVVEFMRATEYKSVMGNGWRNLEISEQILPKFPYKKPMQ